MSYDLTVSDCNLMDLEGGETRSRRKVVISKELREMSTQWRESIVTAGRQERVRLGGARYLLKLSFQTVHIIVAFGFLVLAVVEFVRDPPYFDAVASPRHANTTNIPKDTFYVSKVHVFVV
uniref:Uncharacterized protein n=1 Tax=Amphimedon queenslandica TaxID=400682 RepID=A0A1X7SH14_AMPQE